MLQLNTLVIENAVANQSEAMEAETISKNGKNLKSQMSRKNIFKKAFSTILAAACFTAVAYTQSGYIDDIEWKIVGNKLIISGTGKVRSQNNSSYPWNSYYDAMSKVSTVIIESGVENIPDYAFSNWSKITTVTIPNTVTTIEKNAFFRTGLKTINIPSSVTTMGGDVFNDCDELTSINVDNNNTEYSSENGVLFNKTKTILIRYPEGKTNTVYIIPNTVKILESRCFERCGSKSVTIPSSVTTIKKEAFKLCGRITQIINYATEPQKIDSNDVFSTGARLLVPAESKEVYRKDKYWNASFASIVAIPND